MTENRRLLRAITAFVAAIVITSASVHAQRTPERLQAPTVQRIAVLPFVNVTAASDENWIGVGIAEALAVDFQNESAFDVVPAERISEVLRTAAGSGAPTDPEWLAELGRQLDVAWVINGEFQRLGDRLRITGQLVEVATGSVDDAARIDGLVGDLVALQDEFSTQLRDGVTAAQREPTATDLPPPIPARGVGRFAATPSAGIDGPPPPVAPATINRDASGRATVRAVRVAEPLDIDGTLDEAVYKSVPSFGGFVQQQPDEGAPATERTEAWVFFDNSNVYVAARLWDSAPESRWIASEMQRDSFQLIQNELFSVALDTFYDRRNAVTFRVNPIGGFMDQQITDEVQSNTDWNTIW
jgi:TolB-like protein